MLQFYDDTERDIFHGEGIEFTMFQIPIILKEMGFECSDRGIVKLPSRRLESDSTEWKLFMASQGGIEIPVYVNGDETYKDMSEEDETIYSVSTVRILKENCSTDCFLDFVASFQAISSKMKKTANMPTTEWDLFEHDLKILRAEKKAKAALEKAQAKAAAIKAVAIKSEATKAAQEAIDEEATKAVATKAAQEVDPIPVDDPIPAPVALKRSYSEAIHLDDEFRSEKSAKVVSQLEPQFSTVL